MNEIIHYLYYRFGENLKVQIVNTDIQRKLVHPYENAEFEKIFVYCIAKISHL